MPSGTGKNESLIVVHVSAIDVDFPGRHAGTSSHQERDGDRAHEWTSKAWKSHGLSLSLCLRQGRPALQQRRAGLIECERSLLLATRIRIVTHVA